MRLCPSKALPSKRNLDSDAKEVDVGSDLLSLPEFEKACLLDETTKPGPKWKEWLMRWRGRDMEGTVVGGESRAQGHFIFKYDTESSTDEFKGMKITFTFTMLDAGKHLLFEGIKTSNLAEAEGEEPPQLELEDFETQWRSLLRPNGNSQPSPHCGTNRTVTTLNKLESTRRRDYQS